MGELNDFGFRSHVLPIGAQHLPDRAIRMNGSVPKPQCPGANGFDRSKIVRDKDHCGAFCDHGVDPVEAFLLERGITNSQDLVDEQHVGLEECCDREAEAKAHPPGVELHLTVDRRFEFGEGHDLIEACRHFRSLEPQERAVDLNVLATREIGMIPPITSMSAPIRPATATSPECGYITLLRIFNRLVLPEPFVPTRAIASPGSATRSTSRSTQRHPPTSLPRAR